MLSEEARISIRPFRGYAELARRPHDALASTVSLAERWIVIAIAMGAFVSFTGAGRLVLLHFVSPSIFWAHFVVLPSVVAVVVARVAAPHAKTRAVLSLYLAGAGPWLVFLTLAGAFCVLAPDPGATFRTLLSRGVPIFALFATLVWAAVVTFAFFRAGLALSRVRAIVATLVHHVVLTLSMLAWFLFTGQLLPIFR
jgi:hypothetical protein